MESRSSPEPTLPQCPSIILETQNETQPYTNTKRLSNGCEDEEADSTIHGFNMSNITVIEKPPDASTGNKKHTSCEGSDSGVEVMENTDNCLLKRTLSTNSQEFQPLTPTHSCDSSIISCCSNYEEAYNVLARRNSTLLEDYKLRNGDGTSEGGSESSSVAGSTRSRNPSGSMVRKRVSVMEAKNRNPSATRARSKTSNTTPKLPNSRPPSAVERSRDKTPNSRQNCMKTTKPKPPDNLSVKKDVKRTQLVRSNSTNKTPVVTPTDDGRWPSVYSKPAPLMTRSLRGMLPNDATPKSLRVSTLTETNKTLEKYATLPRRRKEKSADNLKKLQTKPLTRENSIARSSLFRSRNPRETAVLKTLPPYPRRKQTPKIKIYHETCSQTALTSTDIEKFFAGESVSPTNPHDIDKAEKDVQVDMRLLDVEKLQEELKQANEKYEGLLKSYDEQTEKLRIAEEELKGEHLEKEGLKNELTQNTERVLAILSGQNSYGSNGKYKTLIIINRIVLASFCSYLR